MGDDWRIVITGCGTSHGNPPWGWREHWSEDPRDHRRRSGALLLGPRDETVLIDTGPDLMHQLRDPFKDWDGRCYPERCVTRCDGVIITHDHADHSHGLNELRHLNRLMRGRSITVHAHPRHLEAVTGMYPYCFAQPDRGYALASPALHASELTDGVTAVVGGAPVTPFPMSHGPHGRVTGLRCGSMAYCTDCKRIPEDSYAYLQGLELLVLDMLRAEEHVSHFNWEEAHAVIRRLRPRRTVLVHMGHEVRYAEWEGRLPDGVLLAFDGFTAAFTTAGPRWS